MPVNKLYTNIPKPTRFTYTGRRPPNEDTGGILIVAVG
jgi:hypothetical protein